MDVDDGELCRRRDDDDDRAAVAGDVDAVSRLKSITRQSTSYPAADARRAARRRTRSATACKGQKTYT